MEPSLSIPFPGHFPLIVAFSSVTFAITPMYMSKKKIKLNQIFIKQT